MDSRVKIPKEKESVDQQVNDSVKKLIKDPNNFFFMGLDDSNEDILKSALGFLFAVTDVERI